MNENLIPKVQEKAHSSLAVFGGSFNPLHDGHMGIIQALSADAEIDRVLVIPNRISPFKDQAPLLPDPVRWQMLTAALTGLPKVCPCDLELMRPPPSYTCHTVQRLASLHPAARIELALGWDAFTEFSQWHQAAGILSLAGLIVFQREGAPPPPPDLAEWAACLPPPWNRQVRPGGSGGLETAGGRVVVRHLPTRLPPHSSRDILKTRSLAGVPPGAREVLERYWRNPDQG